MQYLAGRALEMKCNAVLVPSTSYLYIERMFGRVAYIDDGIGGHLAARHPSLRERLEEHITSHGNTVFLMTAEEDSDWRRMPFIKMTDEEIPLRFHLVNFPCKPGMVYVREEGMSVIQEKYHEVARELDRVPGYMARAQVGIVEESVKELLTLVNLTTWRKIVVPKFEEVGINDFLFDVLDDRFLLMSP